MKAITIHQPYATLIAIGAKKYETRHWPTKYRGKIAIHAGKNMDGIFELAREVKLRNRHLPITLFADACLNAFKACGHYPSPFTLSKLPIGAVVAIGELVDCIPMDKMDEPNRNEKLFGFWAADRFAWQIENVKFLDAPITVAGKQGLWEWDYPAP